MADPFGIIGVIGVSAQVLQIGVQFGLDWKDAPADARSFKAELQALKTVLSETNTNIILNQDFLDAFQGHHSTLLSELGTTTQTDTRLMLSACQVELELLLEDLTKRVQGHRIGWERLKSAFLTKRTREAVQNLQRQCQSLNTMMAMDSIALGASVFREVKEARKEQQGWHDAEARMNSAIKEGVDGLRESNNSREAAEDRKAILDWLSPIDYSAQQNDFINRRQIGTGQWLLDSEQYQAWLKSKEQTLFCLGIPGAGKTICASIVVDDLTTRFQSNSDTAVAYIYCNFRQHEKQKINDLLPSVLRQLTDTQSFLPESVTDLHTRYKAKRVRPPVEEILKCLRSVAGIYSRVFIVVDALDECQVLDGCRARLLTELFNLQLKAGVNIFATSRFIPEITEQFRENTLLLEIRADDEDVKRYLDGRVSQLPTLVSRNPDIQEEIKTAIVDAVGGMFLLAQLHLDSLAGKRSPKALRTALTKLATGSDAYDHAYKDAMERIESQLKDQQELAKQVPSWIACALRPLTTSELQHALAVEDGELSLDLENLPHIEDMVSVCAGLVTVDEESNIIRLVHYTTQEYFERTHEYWFPTANYDIAKICIQYLCFTDFDSGFCQTDWAFESRLESNKLYDYAGMAWGFHARKGSHSCYDIVEFLQSEVHIGVISQVSLSYYEEHQSDPNYSQNFARQMTGLHFAASLGLRDAAEFFLDDGQGPDCTILMV